ADGGASGGPGQVGTIPSFTLALTAPTTNLEPSKGVVLTVAALVMEPLERVTIGGTPTPNLATSVSRPAGNPTTPVCTIAHGGRFSDGHPLTASDVAWNLERTASLSSLLHGAVVTVVGPYRVKLQAPTYDAALRQSVAFQGLIEEKSFAEAHPDDLGTPAAM